MPKSCENVQVPHVPKGHTRITIVVPADLKRRVRIAAAGEDTTITDLANRLLTEGLDRLDSRAAK